MDGAPTGLAVCPFFSFSNASTANYMLNQDEPELEKDSELESLTWNL